MGIAHDRQARNLDRVGTAGPGEVASCCHADAHSCHGEQARAGSDGATWAFSTHDILSRERRSSARHTTPGQREGVTSSGSRVFAC